MTDNLSVPVIMTFANCEQYIAIKTDGNTNLPYYEQVLGQKTNKDLDGGIGWCWKDYHIV